MLSKRTLIRIVRSPDGVQIDQTGKAPGRGAYLHDQRTCWDRGLKGALASALKTELSEQDREMLAVFAASLPEPAADMPGDGAGSNEPLTPGERQSPETA